jgi:methylthioribose-1-phosphate isomerase
MIVKAMPPAPTSASFRPPARRVTSPQTIAAIPNRTPISGMKESPPTTKGNPLGFSGFSVMAARELLPRRERRPEQSSLRHETVPYGGRLLVATLRGYHAAMKVSGTPMRTIWLEPDGAVGIIDQTRLPHELVTARLQTLDEAAHAIRAMLVRGAPLIGAAASYGVALAMRRDASDAALDAACRVLLQTRPTAVNLRWALDDMAAILKGLPPSERPRAALRRAQEVCDEDVAINRAIGENGLSLLQSAWEKKEKRAPVQVLTHCNAGWLATVDWGTALAPIYAAHDAGLPVHVWVDETRPRNQGAGLTAWELGQHGVPHTVIVDNAGGHLMQQGRVDLCITGTDRTTAAGDVANKIGTYLKALAAKDNGVPFYVALPSPTIDWSIADGRRDIPIEERDASEVTEIAGRLPDGSIARVRLTPEGSPAANYAFDVTPARLVTALITERGVCAASPQGLSLLFPERAQRLAGE